jgi:hypothetical protein
MITFLQWAKENKLDLPVEVAEEDTTDENTKRAGISANYPQAYAGKKYAYPDGYFMPITSTAKGKLDGKIGS